MLPKLANIRVIFPGTDKLEALKFISAIHKRPPHDVFTSFVKSKKVTLEKDMPVDEGVKNIFIAFMYKGFY